MVQLVACSQNNDDRVAADGRRSTQPVFDDQALVESGKELKALIEQRNQSQEDGKEDEYQELTRRIDDLTSQIEAGLTKNGKAKDLNSMLDKLRPRIFGTLRTAYKKMREAEPPLNEVANHFEAAISSESPCFTYRVPPGLRIKWKL